MDDPFVIGEINPSLASRLRAFEGSDDLGNGRFDVCIEAADTIERYEAALALYAGEHKVPNEGPWGADSTDFGNVARDALRSQDKGEARWEA